MATTHDVHRRMEENLFGAFSRQPSSFLGSTTTSSSNNNNNSSSNYRSLTASDLISLPSSINYQQRSTRHIATSVTGASHHNHNNNASSSTAMPLQYKCRPSSDILHAQPTTMREKKSSPEAEAIDRWFENIQRYEQMLEEVAAASLDQGFKDELHHINQWLRCRSDAERTATLYTIVQNASPIQIRFLITVLQQLANNSSSASLHDYPPSTPAGQEIHPTASCASNEVQQQYHYYNNLFSNPSSVISANNNNDDSAAAAAIERKRQLYAQYQQQQQQQPLIQPMTSLSTSTSTYRRRCSPPSFSTSGNNNNNTAGTTFKLKGAMSEPDDLLRRRGVYTSNRDLFSSRPSPSTSTSNSTALGGLSHPGPLYEKALAARAQLQALNNNNNNGNNASSTTSSSSTCSTANSTLSSSSSSSLSSNPAVNASNSNNTGGLFSSPPRLRSSKSSKSLFSNSSTGDWPFPASSNGLKETTTTSHDWLFGSLGKSSPNKKKEDLLSWAIQEEVVVVENDSYLTTLEQAQARLRQDDVKVISAPGKYSPTTPKSLPSFSPLGAEKPLAEEKSSSNEEEDEDEYDTQQEAGGGEEKLLTGLARRRKRSSAARALKDKLAAETVDFELMKDVQNWLRSLRLHKYGHAFIGLDWKQVIRMSDQDMIDAGVNTIGARRKLLKVFENVQRHCLENAIEF